MPCSEQPQNTIPSSLTFTMGNKKPIEKVCFQNPSNTSLEITTVLYTIHVPWLSGNAADNRGITLLRFTQNYIYINTL